MARSFQFGPRGFTRLSGLAGLFARPSTNSNWLTVRPVKLDPTSKKGIDAIRFEWWDGTTATLRDGRGVELFFLRNSPVLIGVSQDGTTARVVISVGGSEVASATATLSAAWKPDRVVFGQWDSANNKATNVCPMLWYGGTMSETSARSIASMTGDLKSLEMLFEKTVAAPPG